MVATRHRARCDSPGDTMTRSLWLTVTCVLALALTAWASARRQQQAAAPPALSAMTRTLYTATTELFAEFRPLIVGEPTRLTAHLTRVGERFRPYTEGSVKLTLTVAGVVSEASAAAPERAGVFRLNVTPTKA